MNATAVTYREWGRTRESYELFSKLLEIQERKFGEHGSQEHVEREQLDDAHHP